MKVIKNIFLTNRFFYILLGLAGLFALSYALHWIFYPAVILTWIFFGITIWDAIQLFKIKEGVQLDRRYPERLSNGDDNPISFHIRNQYPFQVGIHVYESYPIQFQIRDNEYQQDIAAKSDIYITTTIRPTKRGVYTFRGTRILVKYLGFIQRRFLFDEPIDIACYPAFLQLKKYTLLATTHKLEQLGVKRIRRIGANLEFDHIREYHKGDEYRNINWRATAKSRKLMTNQFEEEKAQPIYSLIDTGRSMRMPFNEMTLLDYAINSSLILSNITIIKGDKAGVIEFSKRINKHVVATNKTYQMQQILEHLYQITTDFKESEFGRLYTYVRQHIYQRSLLFLYTNFETLDALERQLPYLQLMNKSHILVVVMFKNSELQDIINAPAKTTHQIYTQTIAEQFMYDKQLIVQKLNSMGIQTILTEPQHLTLNAINKYLEIKARGLI